MIQLLALLLTTSAFASPPGPAPGFADLHNHVFAEYAFGGAWFHGRVEGELSKAMSACDVDFDPFAIWGTHARVKIPIISTFIGKTLNSSGDTGSHLDKVEGFPHFTGWPKWDSIAHQQNWEGYLKEAHESGLTLMVMSAVNFEPLCNLMPEENKKYEDCSDRAAVDRQLDAAHAFEKTHSWFRIVNSPEEARAAIALGKLAVVLSVEVSHFLGDGPWMAELNRLYQQDVRTFQIAVQLNNRFAGVAIHHPIFRIIAWYLDFKARGHWYQLIKPWKFGFDRDPNGKNRQGLTPEGKTLVHEMMARGIPIDLAHLSEKTVHDIQEITTANQNYPVYISHGHFRDAMDDGKFSVWEKSSPDWVLNYIRDSEGMFGLRTGPERTKGFVSSKAPNDCQGSTKSFAQTYQYGAIGKNLHVGFGSDLNGFIQQLRPRFGTPRETCGAEPDKSVQTQQREAQTDPLHKRFDYSGFGNVSQLPDIVTELKNFGVDTTTLEHSSENFIEMWEKAQKIAKKSAAEPAKHPHRKKRQK